jgi:TolB protein
MMKSRISSLSSCAASACGVLLLLAASGAQAQRAPAATVIAIPILATERNVETEAGNTWSIANQIAGLIAANLRTTGDFMVADVANVRVPSFPEVTAPAYPDWRRAGARLLLSGFVNARTDGRLTIGCYLYDVQSGRELARQGFVVTTAEWRRAAHRCADAAYTQVTGNSPLFDSRIAYVARSGSDEMQVKRLAVMDFDGGNHNFLTDGDTIVLTPRWSPSADRIAFTSFERGRPHVRILEVSTGSSRALLGGTDPNFSPAFSPDGRRIALSISQMGTTDLYEVDVAGGFPRRLTTSPAIDTSPSYSPDGRQIAFVSDRPGSPQIYVMNSDGSNQRRISFGAGEYGSPIWSPDGERIAFRKLEGATSRIGVMASNGSDERIVSQGPSDEEPSWSPDGGQILFQRVEPQSRRAQLVSVALRGGPVRPVLTPQGATDPSWTGRQEQGR